MAPKDKDMAAASDRERKSLLDAARRVLLASIGAIALAQDEIEDFVKKLVDRGEIAEKDARKLLREVLEKRRKVTEDEVEKRVEELLDHMNVPTKADIEALSAKIAALTQKVEELKKG